MILDGHTHVGVWNEPSFSGRATDLADAVEVLAATGVRGALTMPTDQADNAGLLAAIESRDPSAAVGFRLCAWIDPRSEDNLEWIRQHASRIAGLKVHPSLVRTRPDDARYVPFLELAAQHGLPVLLHCGRWQEMSSYRFGVDLAQAHPAVAFILCHMGGDSTDLIEATVDALVAPGAPDNVWLGTESIRQYWSVQHAVDRLGPARLIFGSDYNLNHPGSFLAVIDALKLDASGRAAILGSNLNGLLPAAHRF